MTLQELNDKVYKEGKQLSAAEIIQRDKLANAETNRRNSEWQETQLSNNPPNSPSSPS